MSTQTILVGHVLDRLRELPDDHVQCVVTSPPYHGLRSYSTTPITWPDGWVGELGQEPSLDQFIAHLVLIFPEVRRVLRPDGVAFLVIGDSYASAWPAPNTRRNIIGNPMASGKRGPQRQNKLWGSLKEKDLMMVPARLAIALQDDGWYLRADIIWSKKAAMPESVLDRPSQSHEHIFMLTKQPRYFYDVEAAKTPLAESSIDRLTQETFDLQMGGAKDYRDVAFGNGNSSKVILENQRERLLAGATTGANLRNVWHLSPEPFPGAHFATYPTEIPRRCILVGTSERGACANCGSPWRRIVERTPMVIDRSNRAAQMGEFGRTQPSGQMPPGASARTLDWEPTCACDMLGQTFKPDDFDLIETPTGEGDGDPTMETGRRGLGRPRGEDAGVRAMTRYEQRAYAKQLRSLDGAALGAIKSVYGVDTVAHWTRTDRTGARAIPPAALEELLRFPIARVIVPERQPYPTVPCRVLDPFLGSGTTLLVASRLGRTGLGIELNAEYGAMSLARIQGDAPLLASVSIVAEGQSYTPDSPSIPQLNDTADKELSGSRGRGSLSTETG